jgi:hypothetical protein
LKRQNLNANFSNAANALKRPEIEIRPIRAIRFKKPFDILGYINYALTATENSKLENRALRYKIPVV